MSGSDHLFRGCGVHPPPLVDLNPLKRWVESESGSSSITLHLIHFRNYHVASRIALAHYLILEMIMWDSNLKVTILNYRSKKIVILGTLVLGMFVQYEDSVGKKIDLIFSYKSLFGRLLRYFFFFEKVKNEFIFSNRDDFDFPCQRKGCKIFLSQKQKSRENRILLLYKHTLKEIIKSNLYFRNYNIGLTFKNRHR